MRVLGLGDTPVGYKTSQDLSAWQSLISGPNSEVVFCRPLKRGPFGTLLLALLKGVLLRGSIAPKLPFNFNSYQLFRLRTLSPSNLQICLIYNGSLKPVTILFRRVRYYNYKGAQNPILTIEAPCFDLLVSFTVACVIAVVWVVVVCNCCCDSLCSSMS